MAFGPFINLFIKDRQEKLNRKELHDRATKLHELMLIFEDDENEKYAFLRQDPLWFEFEYHMAKLKLVVDQHFHE